MMASTVESSRHQQERQAHDGRPTSAYDNLNGGTKGGGGLKGEGGRKAARSSLGEESIRRSNGGFPYTEISFKFDAIPAASEHQSGVMGRSDDAVTHDECGERNPGAASPPGSQYGGAEKSDKVVNLSEVQQSDEKRRHDHKAIISSAKSNFFGLNGNQSEAEKKDTAEGLTDKGRVPRRRIRLKMDDDEEDSEEYGEETVKLLPEVVNTFNLPATNGYQNVPRNSHKFQHQVSYVQEMKLVESSSSDSAPAKSDVVVPRIKNPARSSTPDNESHRLSQPSQAVYMATTVPQNMKPIQIAGRHVPTRSSLRHSRMLVVNKNFKENGKPNPLNLRHPKWGKTCMVLQILSGILAIGIGLWLLLWAPSTRVQDNPYWSGLILIVCGSLGCAAMDFKRAPRSKSREICFRLLKIKFSVFLVLATLTTLLAALFAAVHLGALSASSTNCLPSNIFTVSSTCVCLFGTRNETTDHLEVLRHTGGDSDKAVSTGGTEFHYRDLNCREVVGPFRYILMGSIATNLVGFVAAATVLILYWTGRRQRRRHGPMGIPQTVAQLPECRDVPDCVDST